MLRALRIGRIEEGLVDAAGSGAQVCEKQASIHGMAIVSITLSLLQNHVYERYLLRYPRPKESGRQRAEKNQNFAQKAHTYKHSIAWITDIADPATWFCS